jgi:hypothetical protein
MRRASKSPQQFFISGTVKDFKKGLREVEVTIRLTSDENVPLRKGDRVSIVKSE